MVGDLLTECSFGVVLQCNKRFNYMHRFKNTFIFFCFKLVLCLNKIITSLPVIVKSHLNQ